MPVVDTNEARKSYQRGQDKLAPPVDQQRKRYLQMSESSNITVGLQVALKKKVMIET